MSSAAAPQAPSVESRYLSLPAIVCRTRSCWSTWRRRRRRRRLRRCRTWTRLQEKHRRSDVWPLGEESLHTSCLPHTPRSLLSLGVFCETHSSDALKKVWDRLPVHDLSDPEPKCATDCSKKITNKSESQPRFHLTVNIHVCVNVIPSSLQMTDRWAFFMNSLSLHINC